MSSGECVRQPTTPPQCGLIWCMGRSALVAEFRTAAKAWTEAYVRERHAVIDCANWEQHKHMAGDVDVLFIALPLPTMARARAIEGQGPTLLRTREWPWGLPGVTGDARRALEADNDLIRLAMSAVREVAAQAVQPTILWTAPEDRGGNAGNLWQLRELRQYASEGGWARYSFNQCEVTSSLSPRPTSVLSFSPLRHPLLRKGWPKLKTNGTLYQGPLEPKCKCGKPHESWATRQRQSPTELEPGVVTWLLKVAKDSGLTRHLRMGKRSRSLARQSPRPYCSHRSSSSSSSTSRSSSSRGSSATCIPSPISSDAEESCMQWDDDAAKLLGLPTRNQDCSKTHHFIHTSEFTVISENPRRGKETRWLRVFGLQPLGLCAASTRRYALCAAHSVSMPSLYALLTA